MEVAGYIASILMGTTLGALGSGGSILTVPILVYLFSLPPTLATGYSLFVVGITAFVGSLVYLRKGEVDFRASFAFALPSIVGVNISRGLILPRIPPIILETGSLVITKESLIMLVFAGLMIAASYSMIKKKNVKKHFNISSALRAGLISLLGLGVGLIAGFVGAGGGFLIIPALVFMAGLSMRVAVGTSLMIIAFQSLLGFAGDISRGLVADWFFLVTIVGCAVAGIIAGSLLASKFEEQKLKISFGWFVLLMGITISIKEIIK